MNKLTQAEEALVTEVVLDAVAHALDIGADPEILLQKIIQCETKIVRAQADAIAAQVQITRERIRVLREERLARGR